jgi:hypothetical protein
MTNDKRCGIWYSRHFFPDKSWDKPELKDQCSILSLVFISHGRRRIACSVKKINAKCVEIYAVIELRLSGDKVFFYIRL